MTENFAEYAIAHEAGHALVGQFVKLSAPKAVSFYLSRGSDGQLYWGDFATSSLFPPDDQIPDLPQSVKNCLCYTLAAGFAATQFSGLSLPGENEGLDSDRSRLGKLTSKSLESFVPFALAIIRQEEKAYREIVAKCMQKYEQLKTEAIEDGNHVLLTAKELEDIFNKTMSPTHAPLSKVEDTSGFRDTMSAHEAGHATLGIILGARIEAVYAIPTSLPNGKIQLNYLTKFGALGRMGLDTKDRILLTAGAAAAEILLIGKWDDKCVQVDRRDLEELGFLNFNYCVEQAVQLLQGNAPLLDAVRDKIRSSMDNLKQCKVTRNGSHIILAKGSEIEKLFRTLGFRVSSASLDLDVARLNIAAPSGI